MLEACFIPRLPHEKPRPVERYSVWTDGSTYPNPGPGGWACCLVRSFDNADPEDSQLYGDTIISQASGMTLFTTTNRMEMVAAIRGISLARVAGKDAISLYSDSAYLVNAFRDRWVDAWPNRGWRTLQGKVIDNQDLWADLIAFDNSMSIRWTHVKGHTGIVFNEAMDKLAKSRRVDSSDCLQRYMQTGDAGFLDVSSKNLLTSK